LNPHRSTIFFVWVCFCSLIRVTGEAQSSNPARGADSLSTRTVKSVRLTQKSPGLAIEITLSAPFVPQAIRLSAPDRLVFDFPGYKPEGASARTTVNGGPVQQIRVSLFQSIPPVTRVVIDSKEALNFDLKSEGNKVIIEIAVPNATSAVAASSQLSAMREDLHPGVREALHDQPQLRIIPSARHSHPTAYELQAKARMLKLENLQALEDKAKSGDPEAETTLALAFHDAVLLKRNEPEALRLLHKAANQNFMAAQESLGIFAETGIGMPKPAPEEALAWYEKAVQQGSRDAATDIALMYSGGIGVAKDLAKAVGWFQQAAEAGDGTAEYNLALMYVRGNGVPQDYQQFVRWATAAANQNVLPALVDLGNFYEHPPDGSAPQTGRAIHYYQPAAEQGVAEAQFRLGELLAGDKDSRESRISAYKWLTLARASIQESGPLLIDLQKSMTQQEIGDAEHKVDSWRRAHGSPGE